MTDRIAEQIVNLNSGQYFEIYFPTCKARVSAFDTNGTNNKSFVIGFNDGPGFLSNPEDSIESIVIKLFETTSYQDEDGEIIVSIIHSY